MKIYECPDLKIIALETEDIMSVSLVQDVGTVVSFLSGAAVPGFEDESGM